MSSRGPESPEPPEGYGHGLDSGARERVSTVLDAAKSDPLTPLQMERLTDIARASRAIPTLLARGPGLVADKVESGLSVALQQAQALFVHAADEIGGRRTMAEATAGYSSWVDDVVEAALDSARREIADRHPLAGTVPFLVVAMGKWGAAELNYASDIDLMFVHGDVPGDSGGARTAALAIASRITSLLTSSSFDGPGLVVDADLRPEGTMGPLSRRLDAYSTYYEKWGEPWELQALVKARPAAGDRELARGFRKLTRELLWEKGLDVEALRGIRRIKKRTEERVRSDDVKRAPGGIRDIEFTVQMLQLVHGRHDPNLRVRGTLGALDALVAGEYITPEENEELAGAYVFLRRLEHAIQLWDLRQTHRFPSDEDDRNRIARLLGHNNGAELVAALLEVRSRARTLHERIYFRPVLDSLVGSPSARLGPKRADERLSALGFANTEQARAALGAMTRGLSRRSRAMQQMLPLMLDWLSLSPSPDLGLNQLRLLLSNTADHSTLVARLLSNPATGERLAMLLGTGRLLGDLMDRIPEFVPRLSDDAALVDIRNREAAQARLDGLLASRPELEDRIGTIRRFARRRRLRIAARDVLTSPDTNSTVSALSDTADVALVGAVAVATEELEHEFATIAMGRWGGEELSYGSDLDVFHVFGDMDRSAALEIPARLHTILSEPGIHGQGYDLDADIRPEGRKGPVARSLESTRRYYEEWAEPWEHLALIRARGVAGEPAVLSKFEELKSEVLWAGPAPSEMVASIRKIKARVEDERISPDEDPDFHLKLGPGSLSDIEFLVQLLQLTHGHAEPDLRVTGTVPALRALLDLGIISAADHLALYDSYEFCTRVRLRLHLQRGRAIDSLPTDPDLLSELATSLGYDRSIELREAYRRVTRRARRVFVHRFYE